MAIDPVTYYQFDDIRIWELSNVVSPNFLDMSPSCNVGLDKKKGRGVVVWGLSTKANGKKEICSPKGRVERPPPTYVQPKHRDAIS